MVRTQLGFLINRSPSPMNLFETIFVFWWMYRPFFSLTAVRCSFSSTYVLCFTWPLEIKYLVEYANLSLENMVCGRIRALRRLGKV